MRGTPWTFGPDGEGRMLAAAACAECDAQLTGSWVAGEGDNERDVEAKDRARAVGEARQAAVDNLRETFSAHECPPPGTGLFCVSVAGDAK